MFIRIQKLCFHYKSTKDLTICDFQLDINKGEIISIVGDSGSGKSTILRLIAGLEVPRNGSIAINGRVVTDDTTFVPPEERGVGLVFQDYALFPHMTVADNITFGLKGWARTKRQQRLRELLELVGLPGFEQRYPYELSGGQQQRVALARALAPNPSLLMFDEPFSNLDKDIQYKIREELHAILKGTGITSIFVTHDMDDSRVLADRVVVMKHGKIENMGSPEEILDRKELVFTKQR
jgi:iron(III) transport system ATP-binding protein